ncbi:MAG: ABC transporter substrate-binding protein [Brevibacterium yomogidense]|uniref:ABC transporter substrate-binding protein n=1 Tax=Brevibacterium sp. Mu109 TaxID=1255669 RepID=UPI000C408509|nr:ABC transporter substrate-binding protein [Brevibacterium sp. Mu109]SMX83788.1 peptide/nickel transport system substrate-binding protein [Brevibacterium sp. Mu109]
MNRTSTSRAMPLTGIATALALLTTGCAVDGEGGAAAHGSDTGEPLRVGAVEAAGQTVDDPHGSLFNESDWLRLSALYDTLIGVDTAGDPAPGIAEEWTASDDATTWTLTLRDDAVFSDGVPVTSADVMHSLERMDALSAENGQRLGTVSVGESSAPDDHTVVLSTTMPDADLPRTLAGSAFIVPDGTEDFSDPIGSGPFNLTARADQGAELERNGEWWGSEERVDALEIRGFESPQAMSSAIESAEIDIAMGVDPTTAAAAAEEFTVVQRENETTTPLLMRLDEEPFDSPEVREAVKIGLDREELVETVHLGYGTVGADLPQPADPSAPDLQAPERDVDRARDLLAGAGVDEDTTVDLHTTSAYPSMPVAAEAIAEQLGEIGLSVEVVEHDPQTYWSETYTQVPFSIGYNAYMPYPVWARQTALSTSAFNETGWQDELFDEDFARALATVDEAERNEILGELQTRFAEEGGLVAWGHGDGLSIVRDGVEGVSDAAGMARVRLVGVTR